MEDDAAMVRADAVAVPEIVAARPVVVTAIPLKRAARDELARLLGARVVDVRDPDEQVDLVLTPSCSPQLVGALKAKYPGARVVIVELDDDAWDIELSGPVKRVLRAGADGYVLADSMADLARRLGVAAPVESPPERPAGIPDELGELTEGSTVDDVIASFLRESAAYAERLARPVLNGEEHDGRHP